MNKALRSAKYGVVIIAVVLAGGIAFGGVPFNNLQGVGGAAFNPLAYPAGQNKADGTVAPLSRPQFGAWYTHLGEVDVDWTAIGVAETLFDRVEVSYGYELIAPAGENIDKSNVGGKILVVPENAGGNNFVPAVSVGTIWKTASNVAEGSDESGVDYYGVATKLITQSPWPILLSGGVLSTKEQVTGVFGFNEDRDITGFGNIDVVLPVSVAVGLEFKQGAKFDSFENANYWDAHLAWIANKNLTLIGAYVNAGDDDSTSKVGLGDGVALSAQYAF